MNRNGRNTADRIAAAAASLLCRGGADAVTMRRVAKAVRITPMAVYRHYPDRAGLLRALADKGFADLAFRLAKAPLTGNIEQQLATLHDIFLDLAFERPRLFELMFLRLRPGARRFPHDFKAGASPTANFIAALIEKGIKSGALRRDDAWEITFEMGALLEGLVMLYLGGRVAMPVEEFRAYCHRSFQRYLHGIRA